MKEGVNRNSVCSMLTPQSDPNHSPYDVSGLAYLHLNERKYNGVVCLQFASLCVLIVSVLAKKLILCYYVNKTLCKLNATQVLHIDYTNMIEITKVVFSVAIAVVLQAVVSVSQLTAERHSSIDQSTRNYVIDIVSPDVSEMKQVNVYLAVIFIVR